MLHGVFLNGPWRDLLITHHAFSFLSCERDSVVEHIRKLLGDNDIFQEYKSRRWLTMPYSFQHENLLLVKNSEDAMFLLLKFEGNDTLKYLSNTLLEKL